MLLQGLIVLFVIMGLLIVVGLPYMLAKRKKGGMRAPRGHDGDSKGGFSLATLIGGKAVHSS